MFEDLAINYLAVLGGAVACMALGMAWYSPFLFGKSWMKLSGLSDADCAAAKKKGMAKTYLAAFVNCLLVSFALAFFMDRVGAIGVSDGIAVAVVAWLGFAVTVLMAGVLWDKKPFALFLINAGYYLAEFLIVSVILSLFQ